MAAPHQIEVDLSDPERLDQVERDYLRVSVCPVPDHPNPGLLVPVTVILKLPGDVQVASAGKVIQVTGPRSFLVQLDSPPDLERLKRIAAEPPRAPRAPMPRRATGPIPVTPRAEARVKVAREAPPPPGGPAAVAEIDLDFLDEMAEASQAPRPAAGAAHGRRSSDPAAAAGRAAHATPQAAPRATPSVPVPAVPTIALVDTLLDPDLDMGLVGRLPTGGPATAATAVPPEGPGEDAPLPDLDDPPVSSLEHWTPDLDALLEPGAVEPATGAPRPPAPAVTGNESDTSDVYARIKNLTLPEKQRLARHGRRPVRNLLIRDPNKNLHRLVVANPDVGMDEITEYSAYPGLSKEAIEFIAQNRTWVAMRQVAFNLVRNPATPVDVAVRLVPRLGPNEWRWLARPGAVRMPIAAAARKQIVEGAS